MGILWHLYYTERQATAKGLLREGKKARQAARQRRCEGHVQSKYLVIRVYEFIGYEINPSYS